MNLTADGKALPLRGLLSAKMLLVMRLTAIVLLAATLQVSATGLSQTVTLSKKNATLEQVFESLQQQTGFSFLFNSHMLAQAKRVTIHVRDVPVEEVLTQCFKDQPFTYVVQDKTIIVKEKEKPAAVGRDAAPAPGHIRGTVKDENNSPIEGAAITVKGLSTGTVTDKQGKFYQSSCGLLPGRNITCRLQNCHEGRHRDQ